MIHPVLLTIVVWSSYLIITLMREVNYPSSYVLVMWIGLLLMNTGIAEYEYYKDYRRQMK